MLTRRNFLQNSLLGAAFLQNSSLFANNSENKTHPLVLTTWNNFKASQVAWDMLAQDALALDAVEQGLRVPEADPNDTSVGFGGMPDRDGHVTLDACIMDEKVQNRSAQIGPIATTLPNHHSHPHRHPRQDGSPCPCSV